MNIKEKSIVGLKEGAKFEIIGKTEALNPEKHDYIVLPDNMQPKDKTEKILYTNGSDGEIFIKAKLDDLIFIDQI